MLPLRRYLLFIKIYHLSDKMHWKNLVFKGIIAGRWVVMDLACCVHGMVVLGVWHAGWDNHALQTWPKRTHKHNPAVRNYAATWAYVEAGFEQLFDCLAIQNRQAMHFIGRSIDWTLEDNMVGGLFFCATLTIRRRDRTPICASRSGNVQHRCGGG